MGAQWRCHQSGDCCRNVGTVIMTPAERIELERASDRPMTFRDRPDGFVELVGSPACPLLDDDGRCSVYAVRPYNCRRWGCFRPTTDEPFAMAVIATHDQGTMPIRVLTSKPAARQYRRMQAQAMPWALAHGWVPEI